MSDAGAPLISDPGYPLIQKCIELDLEFTVLPGPSSVINAILLCWYNFKCYLVNRPIPGCN